MCAIFRIFKQLNVFFFFLLFTRTTRDNIKDNEKTRWPREKSVFPAKFGESSRILSVPSVFREVAEQAIVIVIAESLPAALFT